MVSVIFWAIVFSITTSISIVLLGSRDLIAGEIGLMRMVHIILNWKFILGALLAFLARLFFIMTNNAIYKIPELSASSTTITTLINSAAVILVVIANHYFLSERITFMQGAGALVILVGIYMVTV